MLKILLYSALFMVFAQQGISQSRIPDTLNKKRVYTVIGLESAAYIAGISYLQFIWYREHERVPFHFYDDSRGYLQMDKWGHAYAAYYQSLASYHALRWAGMDKRRALWYGGPAGLLFQTPIEIFDALYEGWGFSWTDMIANAVGPALFISQEAVFDQQIVRMKFSYSPSGYPRYHPILGENELESFFLDYNGHTYWLSANLKSLTGLEWMPSWLSVAMGYSANGMIKEFENPLFYQGKPFPHLERYRQYVISLDIDWTRIETDKPWLRSLFQTLNLIKIPFPALEYNRLHGIRTHWLYF
jgi:hypothetical protein